MNKIIHTFLLLLIINCCSNRNIDSTSNFIYELSKNSNEFSNLKDILTRYNVEKPQDIYLEDSNYNYLFAKLFYKHEAYRTWFFYYINNALTSGNLFKEEAFWLLVDYLLKNRSWDTLKEIVKNNKEIFSKNFDKKIYIIFAENKPLRELGTIPSSPDIFPLLYEVIKNNKSALKEPGNQEKIIDYLIETKIYENKEFEYKNEIKNLVVWSNYNPFLSCLYYYLTNSWEYFINAFGVFLKENHEINEDKINIIKKLSIKLGVRKQFFNKLSIYKEYNNIYQYFYGLEVIYFVNYKILMSNYYKKMRFICIFLVIL